MQTGIDTDEETPVASSTDMGDADLDAIIEAGGSFDDQSATGASGAYAAALQGCKLGFAPLIATVILCCFQKCTSSWMTKKRIFRRTRCKYRQAY